MADRLLFYLVIALYTISLIMSYSLSTFLIPRFHYEPGHFLFRQGSAILLGIAIMWVFSWLDPDRWFKPIGFTIFIVFSAIMIAMPILPESIAKTALGAKRWVSIGSYSLAPVEFFKVGFIFFIAWSFPRKVVGHGKLTLKEEFYILLPYIVLLGVSIIFIAIFQKDLGQVVVLASTLLVLFLIVGRSLKLFFTLLGSGFLAMIILIIIAPHRIHRIKSWWSMVQDSFLSWLPDSIGEKFRVVSVDEPYQISNSLNAIYNGHWWGQGLGNGQFKLGYLSEVNTDFILSGLAEELGFFALMVVVFLILSVIFRILQIASKLKNPIYYIFTVGVALLIFFAFIINSYGISGLTPIKGIAVPFLSYGGSQIIASSIAIGMVLMVSKKVKV